jgi:peptidoglycan/LPS O-acetylase OafA/YrhL
MARPRGPLFVERQSYRRRRLMDAARILPVLGFVLVLLPVLWTQGGTMGTAGQALYLFGLWVALILAAALLSRPLGRDTPRHPGAAPPGEPPPTPPTGAKSQEPAP